MSEKKKCICNQCEFHDTDMDYCRAKNVEECSKQELTECEEFLVKDKLVHF